MVQPGYRDERPLYGQITDGIRKMILTHAVEENEILPSVRELALKLTVNPAAVEHAYGRLEEDGYIKRKPDGAYTVLNIKNCRKQELLKNFDCVVTELLGLSAHADELVIRVCELAEGEMRLDRSE